MYLGKSLALIMSFLLDNGCVRFHTVSLMDARPPGPTPEVVVVRLSLKGAGEACSHYLLGFLQAATINVWCNGVSVPAAVLGVRPMQLSAVI